MQDKKDLFATIRLMFFLHKIGLEGCGLGDRISLIRQHMHIHLNNEEYWEYMRWEDEWPRAKTAVKQR